MQHFHPLQHRMGRRSTWKDYSAPGIYHITIRVEDVLGHPFGHVVGSLDAAAGSADAPRVALTPVGEMVERELLHTITAHYPMVKVQEYVVMPEHLHFIVGVCDTITSHKGKVVPLGQVIAGFKTGCNRLYWGLTGQTADKAAKPLSASASGVFAAGPSSAPGVFASGPSSAPGVFASGPSSASGVFAAGPSSASGGFAAGPSSAVSPSGSASGTGPKPRFSSGRQPLFAEGYVDVMPLHPGQLDTQRAYIKDNPRSRLLRTLNRSWMGIQRGGIATALTLAALRGFLQRECPASACTPAILAEVSEHLLMAPDGTITCDTYGDRQLLMQPQAQPSALPHSAALPQAPRLLPVVCHRRDASLFQQHKARCLQAAQEGAVLVSARISKGEQDIIDTVIAAGLPVVLIPDNGFADRYHPSAERLDQCAGHRLLYVTPWHYHYQYADSAITVAVCKTMNCLAQALCRQKDTWWKT